MGPEDFVRLATAETFANDSIGLLQALAKCEDVELRITKEACAALVPGLEFESLPYGDCVSTTRQINIPAILTHCPLVSAAFICTLRALQPIFQVKLLTSSLELSLPSAMKEMGMRIPHAAVDVNRANVDVQLRVNSVSYTVRGEIVFLDRDGKDAMFVTLSV